jgi:hypothetical protein
MLSIDRLLIGRPDLIDIAVMLMEATKQQGR